MTTVSEAFPSKYLAGDDLKAQDRTVVISNYQTELMGQDNEQKIVLHFQGVKKGLVLNKTNAKTIALIHGNEMDGWLGKQITIGGAWIEAFGEQKFSVRVRPDITGTPAMETTADAAADELGAPGEEWPTQAG